MRQDEKDLLIEFFGEKEKWCQGVDALDGDGNAVRRDDDSAKAWDLIGGLFRLFGERRATRLCETVARHVSRDPSSRRRFGAGVRDLEWAVLITLLDFNDSQTTDYEVLMHTLRDLPVWSGKRPDFSALLPD